MTPESEGGQSDSREQKLFAEALRDAEGAARASSGASDVGPAMRQAAPDSFPGYDIRRFIKRGGQGAVFEAWHAASRRRVAIKVLREGLFTSAQERSRFEREIELLSRIRHPGIVAIHDSGATEGSSYHVMDFVDGLGLDDWLAATERPTEELVRTFVKICEAVSAAHLRGVIHRDLKPANILVDETGDPHILDFGLAKLRGDLDEQTQAVTITGQFVGSLPWASPEQASGAVDDLDSRSDVYSLGVILFHMLTGSFPYPVIGRMRDVIDHIASTAPMRPNVLLRREARRAVDPDLESVVLRCLEKERERRYESAGELAREIGRYQRGEPIEARSDSGWYVFTKTMRRHRIPVAIAASFVALLVCSTAAMAYLYGEARDERNRANGEVRRAKAGMDVLQGVIESIDGVSSLQDGTPALEHAEEAVAREWADDPFMEARLRYAVSVGFRYTSTRNPMASYIGVARQIAAIDAIELPNSNAARRLRYLFGYHRATIHEYRNGAIETLSICERQLALAQSDPAMTTDDLIGARLYYGLQLGRAGRASQGIRVLGETFNMARDHSGAGSIMAIVIRQEQINMMIASGDCDGALEVARNWYGQLRGHESPDPGLYASATNTLGNALELCGNLADAAKYRTELESLHAARNARIFVELDRITGEAKR